MKRGISALLFLFVSSFFIPGNSCAKEVKVFTSNYPLAYFAETISGKPEAVMFPEIDGDPAFWEPVPDDIIAMQQADVILLNGATYEKWKTHVSLPRRKIVETAGRFKDQFLGLEYALDHSHGPSGDHAHTGTAFTTWMDLSLAERQAEAVKNALVSANIAPESELNKNFEALKRELMAIDQELKDIAAGNSQIPLVASHPVYQYFARRYDLNLQAVLWEPDIFPEEDKWNELGKLVKGHPAKWMIWEGEPLPESVSKLKAMGIESIVFDPCGNRPNEGGFISTMKKNVANLRNVFKEEESVFCTADVKECPDGSYVSRKPPTCAFEACLPSR